MTTNPIAHPLARPLRPRLLGAASVALVMLAAGDAPGQTLTREQQAAFLRTAKIVDSVRIGKGVTQPYRLTLTDGTITHDAAFQSIDQRKSMSNTGRGGSVELNFVDSWRFNVAAPIVAELLGIGDMTAVSVERSWNATKGALTWWVDDVAMDDGERRKRNIEPPDADDWHRQMNRMRVFTELVYDTDRNLGNILVTHDWRIVMIDFTRAFRAWHRLHGSTGALRRCDRAMLGAMRALTKERLEKAAGPYLTKFEIDALLARRDVLVSHFDDLVARLGEARVLY